MAKSPSIYDYTETKQINITSDALDIKLRDFETEIKRRKNIFVGLGVCGSFGSTILTVSQFNNFLGIKGDTWYAIYIVAATIALAWTVYEAFRVCVKAMKKKSLTREKFLAELLDESRKKA